MFSVIVNTLTVLVGGCLGLLLKKSFPERLEKAVMTAIGLCSICIGVDGALKSDNVLVLIIAMVVGSAIGTLLNLDGGIDRLGKWVEKRFPRSENGKATVAEGFVSASLLFCVGAMTLVGSLNAGLVGDHTMLLTKSMLDFCSSIVLAAALGVGVVCSSAFVFVLEGGLVLLSGVLAPLLSDAAIVEMTAAGSVTIIAIGLNVLGITKIKAADQVPAIVVAPLLLAVFNAISALFAVG